MIAFAGIILLPGSASVVGCKCACGKLYLWSVSGAKSYSGGLFPEFPKRSLKAIHGIRCFVR